MKTFIIALTLTIFLASVPFAFARGGNRWFTIDRKWEQIQAWQKGQDRMFKRIERDAARDIREGDAPAETYGSKGIICAPCGR